MTRALKGAARRQAKNRWFKRVKGYRGSRSRCWRKVKSAVIRSGVYATEHRKDVKRDYRSLWIIRIGAALEPLDMKYSRFIAGLKSANILLNRKMLSEIAIADPETFAKIVDQAKAGLAKRQSQTAAAA